MRYQYRGTNLVPATVRHVEKGGMIISNPPDSLVDELKAGYPLTVEKQPEYDLETEILRPYYTLEAGKIIKGWKVESIDPDPGEGLEARVEALERENAALKAAIEAAVE